MTVIVIYKLYYTDAISWGPEIFVKVGPYLTSPGMWQPANRDALSSLEDLNTPKGRSLNWGMLSMMPLLH